MVHIRWPGVTRAGSTQIWCTPTVQHSVLFASPAQSDFCEHTCSVSVGWHMSTE
jgi:hypothetical protein